MRIAASAAKLGYFDWDLVSDNIVCSPRVREMFGLSGEAVTSVRQLADCLHPDDRPRREQLLKVAIENQSDYDIEYRVIWSDKTIHWISTRGRAYYDEAGKPVRFGGIMADVTERKELEQALIRSEKLASVGRMAATIAHEINNPLAAVMNLLYLVGSDPDLPDSARNYLFTAQQEIERAAHITKQTLGFYREATRPRRVDVRELVEGVLELYAPRLVNRAVKVERRYDESLYVYVIEGELRQVVSNLISNAIDATPELGGRLKVHAIHTTASAMGRALRITIGDNGSGIAPEVKTRIFEPFFTTKVSVGTGLGLWVTRDIVSRNGGRIRLKSRVGKGSVFSIILPAEVPAKPDE
jgi:PAS domain S-box-containing protein